MADAGTDGLIRDWDFVPSGAPLRISALRLRNALLHRVPAPDSRILKSGGARARWSAYFIFSADGQLGDAHRFTLDRLRALDRDLLVVCAAPSPADVPSALYDVANLLLWKALPGFDFSAYGLALRTLADHAPGSDVLVLNDSIFGPFGDLETPVAAARWDLTGFTATANVENHIQSFAFHLRNVTPAREAALQPVFRPAYDSFWDVVLNQETRFARVAAQAMSVGALYYSPNPEAPDPMLQRSLELVGTGFPFLKRSLLGKLAHLYPRDSILAALETAGHPRP